MRLDIEVAGAAPVTLELRNLAKRTTNAEPALRRVADLLRHIEAERFDAEGPGWAPLAPSTLEHKRREGLADRILQATGEMRESFAEPGGSNIEHVSGETLIFGSSDPKARYHQSGTERMPQRKVIDLGSRERSQVTKLIQSFVIEGEARPSYRIAIGI